MPSLGDLLREWDRGAQAVARGDWDCALRLFSGYPEPSARMCFNVGCVHLLAGNPEAALRVSRGPDSRAPPGLVAETPPLGEAVLWPWGTLLTLLRVKERCDKDPATGMSPGSPPPPFFLKVTWGCPPRVPPQ